MNKKITVNGRVIEIKNNQCSSGSSPGEIKARILRWFSRIGITEDFVDVQTNVYGYESPFAEIKWEINGEEYFYKCDSQKDKKQCLAAIEQLVHSEVLLIERGIKSFGMAMGQFKLGYDPSGTKYEDPYTVLDIDKKIKDINYIEYKYKQLAREHHPDAGGNVEKFTKIKEAFETIKKDLEK